MADKKNKNLFTNGNELPSVADVLRSNRNANEGALDSHKKDARRSVSATPESLDELLKKGRNKQNQVSKTNRTNDTRVSELPDIENLVKSSPQTKTLAKNTASAKSEKSLDQIISSPSGENTVQQKTQSQNVGTYKNRYLSFGVLALLAVIGVGIFNMNQNQQQIPKSDVAQQLMNIVNGIEKYRLENNQSPEKLSDLPEFPKNAVEWEVEQYDIQLESRALELFFLLDSTGYIVISRYENEAWMYTDNGNPKLRRIPAR